MLREHKSRWHSQSSNYFLIKSSTATSIAVIPVLIVGAGSGAQNAECKEGSDSPVSWDFLKASCLTPPTTNMQMGIFGSTRPYSEKSSPPIVGLRLITFASPKQD